MEVASQRAKLLFGCYRRGDANDPDTYVTAVTATLTSFDEPVVMYVTDPRTGLPGTCQFLPTVQEVRAACIGRTEQLIKLKDAERWLNRQVMPRLRPPPVPEGEDFDSMCAKHGRPLGRFESGTKWEALVGHAVPAAAPLQPISDAWKPPTDDELRARYAKPQAAE